MSSQYATIKPNATTKAPIPVDIKAFLSELAPCTPDLNEALRALPILPTPVITFLNLLARPPVASSSTDIAPSPASPASLDASPNLSKSSAALSAALPVCLACDSNCSSATFASSMLETDCSRPSISKVILTTLSAITIKYKLF